jgi:hypothetical protein
MQLEQTLEMYQPMQMQRTQQRERVYNLVDLESLSASALYTGDSGSSGGGASWIGSTDYIKDLPKGQLHVHAPKGKVTGANLDGKPISNYEAAILDLQRGKVHKDTRNF